MKTTKITATLLHAILPVACGCFIYLFRGTAYLQLAADYLPDALWAYAFLSALLITWNGKIPAAWLGIAFLSAIAFEAGQYKGIIAGTGDWLDIAVYFVAFGIALLTHRRTMQSSIKITTT